MELGDLQGQQAFGVALKRKKACIVLVGRFCDKKAGDYLISKMKEKNIDIEEKLWVAVAMAHVEVMQLKWV